MIIVTFSKLRCNTCNDPLETQGVIVQERPSISGKVTQLCFTCSRFFRKGIGVKIVMEWREGR